MNYYTKPVKKNFIKQILNQMENYFVKIIEKDDKFDLGLFCNIKYQK